MNRFEKYIGGENLPNFGNLLEELEKCTTPQEVAKLKADYQPLLAREGLSPEEINARIENNLGFLIGECDPETAERLIDLGLRHPVFGCSIPGPKDAVVVGKQLAETTGI